VTPHVAFARLLASSRTITHEQVQWPTAATVHADVSAIPVSTATASFPFVVRRRHAAKQCRDSGLPNPVPCILHRTAKQTRRNRGFPGSSACPLQTALNPENARRCCVYCRQVKSSTLRADTNQNRLQRSLALPPIESSVDTEGWGAKGACLETRTSDTQISCFSRDATASRKRLRTPHITRSQRNANRWSMSGLWHSEPGLALRSTRSEMHESGWEVPLATRAPTRACTRRAAIVFDDAERTGAGGSSSPWADCEVRRTKSRSHPKYVHFCKQCRKEGSRVHASL
jgi:hypothetical protein